MCFTLLCAVVMVSAASCRSAGNCTRNDYLPTDGAGMRGSLKLQCTAHIPCKARSDAHATESAVRMCVAESVGTRLHMHRDNWGRLAQQALTSHTMQASFPPSSICVCSHADYENRTER